MQAIKEQIVYQQGYIQALHDIFDYLFAKTNGGVDDKISALDVLENFIVPKTTISHEKAQEIKKLIPNKN